MSTHKPKRVTQALLLFTRALLLLACTLMALTCARAQSPAPESKEPAGVAGRVTNEEHGIAGVLVMLMPAQFSPQTKAAAKAMTDADGRYRLTNVPPGSYYLNMVAPVYVNTDPATVGQGRLFNLKAGEQLDGLDFTLARGGVVTGRVVDVEGKPVIEAHIRLIAADEADRRKPQYSLSPFAYQTDDRGIYRVYGLAAGRYLVSVGEGQDERFITVGRGGSYIPRTFYGDTSDMAQAKPVEVTTGAETSGIDITVGKPTRTYEAAGRVVDERGQPVAGASMIYGRINENRFDGGLAADGTRTNEQGEFHLRNLLPGHYGLYASQGQAFGPEARTSYSNAVPVEIIDQDVNGVEIKLTHGATLSGTLVIEGTINAAALAHLTDLHLFGTTQATEGLVPPASPEARINADGTFQITGLRPGRVHLELGYPPVKGFTLTHVQHDGIDQAQGIEVAAGAQVTGVRVVVTYGASVIRGQVQFAAGARVAGAHYYVVAHRTGAARSAPGAQVDELGRFVIEDLGAGEYELTLRGLAPMPNSRPSLQTSRTLVNVPDSGEVQVTLLFPPVSSP